MSTTTTNLNLVKPALNDSADISIINQNMDIIDNTITSINTDLTNHKNDSVKHITSAERSNWNSKQDAIGYTPVNKNGDIMTSFLTLNADPVNSLHAATKQYVDSVVSGLEIKQSVKVATTTNITLSGIQTIDGITVSINDRVLVKNQTTASQNGIYIVQSGSWNRSSDSNSSTKLTPGAFVFVEQGTINADTGWVLSTDGVITIDTTAITWTQFSSAGVITVDITLSKVGNQIGLKAGLVTPGTYPKVTVDTYGRTTSGGPLTSTDLPSASTAQQGAVQLEDVNNSISTTKAPTSNALKGVNDNLTNHTSDNVKHITSAERTTWNGKLDASQKGTANGVASLDSGVKLPLSQLPTHTHTVADLPSASTSASGVVQLEDVSNSTSVVKAPTSNALKGVNDNLNTHINDGVKHITSAERTAWNGKLDPSGGTMTGFLNLNSDPTTPLQAATKQYVDAVASGLDVKKSVRVATTTNISLSGTQTIDGILLVVGDRVLVKNQTTGSQNGIYDVQSGTWTRSTDSDNGTKLNSGAFTFVEQGTIQADTGWVLSTDGSITVGTTSLSFTQFSSAGVIGVDSTLSKAGNTIGLVQGVVAPGTFTKVTVDQYGRVVGNGQLTASDSQVADAGNIINATDVEGALQEIVTNNNAHLAEKATVNKASHVKPDGITTTVDTNGTISATPQIGATLFLYNNAWGGF